MKKVVGKGNISAEVVAHSKAYMDGNEIVTFVLEYPRLIHAEMLVHRALSRNSASSRAIPVSKMLELVETSPAMPVYWGKNQAGMQATEELDPGARWWANVLWKEAAQNACDVAESLVDIEAHKQIVNRILEPFQMMRVVVTATEWDNFFYLRNHTDAQPEIMTLSKVMLEALEGSEPEILMPGEWHTPFVWHSRELTTNEIGYHIGEVCTDSYAQLTLEEALKVSASCCAQLSYRKNDTSVEKALDIYDRLVGSVPVHASPFEHQATPMEVSNGVVNMSSSDTWEDGVTHQDRIGYLWSGNFKEWIQYRQLIPNHTCYNYIPHELMEESND